MMPMISHCGLTCTECPAYKATQTNDPVLARSVAEGWAKAFNANITIDDVWCDGCLVEGRKCTHCGECQIRACSMERKLENCAFCDDYACSKLEGLFAMAPFARNALDGIRAAREA